MLEEGRGIIFSDEPLEKLSEDPSFFKCKFCDYQDECHYDAIPQINCRTCAHSTAERNGTWTCSGGPENVVIDEERQLIGCTAHVYNPYLIPLEFKEGSGDSATYHLPTKAQSLTALVIYLQRSSQKVYTLRYYQQEAVDSIFDYFSTSEGNPIVVLPTGAGKSLVIAAFAKEVDKRYTNQRILKLTHRKELIQQNYDKIVSYWPEVEAGIYSAGLNRKELGMPVTFAGIQSLARVSPQLIGI